MGRTAQRYPWVAAALSLLWPGLGHLYIGKPGGFVAAFVVVWSLVVFALFVGFGSFPGLVAVLALGLVAELAFAVLAARSARPLGAFEPRWYSRWYALGPILAAATFVVPELFSATILPIARYRAYTLPTGSMEPTLLIRDRFVVDTWRYREQPPRRGDIVVFRYPPAPDREMVKRCVAVGGDAVELVGKTLVVNGESVPEPYVVHTDVTIYPPDAPRATLRQRDHLAPLRVSPGSVFLMGDNRDNSYDSRFWGAVDAAQVTAKALYVYWSSSRDHIGRNLE